MTNFGRPSMFIMGMLTLMALSQWAGNLLKPEITYGDLAAVLSPIIVSIVVGVVVAVCARWRKNHPFSFQFSEAPFDIDVNAARQRKFRKKWIAFPGEARLTIAVRTRTETTANPFNIRFVERGVIPWVWRDAKTEDIELIKVSAPDWEREAPLERDHTGPNDPLVQPDGMGGFSVNVRLQKRWVVGRILWVEVVANAKRPWHGYLSFEGSAERLAHARRQVIVWPEFM